MAFQGVLGGSTVVGAVGLKRVCVMGCGTLSSRRTAGPRKWWRIRKHGILWRACDGRLLHLIRILSLGMTLVDPSVNSGDQINESVKYARVVHTGDGEDAS